MQYIFSILDVNALPTCNAWNANVHYLKSQTNVTITVHVINIINYLEN